MGFWAAIWRTVLKRKQMTVAQASGAWGEELAARLLAKEKGYKIVGRNVRFGARCELDIVAWEPVRKILVFVEVKTRKSEDFGRPIEAVTSAKKKALSRAAVRYLQKTKQPKCYLRFDVVEVVGSPAENTPPTIRHIENVFTLQGRYALWF